MGPAPANYLAESNDGLAATAVTPHNIHRIPSSANTYLELNSDGFFSLLVYKSQIQRTNDGKSFIPHLLFLLLSSPPRLPFALRCTQEDFVVP